MSVFRWCQYVLLISLLAIFAGTAVVAQSVLPPDESLDGKPKESEKAIEISARALELAENYIYVLEQLRFLAHDYSRYLAESEVDWSKEYRKAVIEISKKLAEGTYYEKTAELQLDLTELNAKIAEAKLAHKEDLLKQKNARKELSKTLQLIASLGTELDVIRELLDAEVSTESEEYIKHSHDIQLYLRERQKEEALKRIKLEEILPELDELPEITATVEVPVAVDVEPGKPHRVVVITEGLPKPETVLVAPQYVWTVPETPETPEVPDISRSLDILYDKGGKGVRYVRVCADSSDEVSADTPIYVHNPIGDLNIVGWNRDYVRVNADIVVTAETAAKAEKFAKQIDVRTFLKKDRLYVETEIPRLTDPKTKVTGSTVYVRLPRNNSVVCQSSFGQIDVTGMRKSIKVKAEYCTITANDVQGSLVIYNNNGEVLGTGLEGSISIKNANAPVELKACSGDMEIENSAATITILGSEGDITLRNSGLVSVIGHDGDVRIQNDAGSARIERLELTTTVHLVGPISGDNRYPRRRF